MTRATDPIALTHRQWRPRTYARKPQRVAVRQQMHGSRILPADKPRDRSAKWFVALAIVIAAFFALQLLRWFV